MKRIHHTAIVDAKAELAGDVEIGPYSVIGGEVKIDGGSVVGPHVVIKGSTEIGKNNRIFQFASIGEINQDLKYKGEKTRLVIGDFNSIREFTTVQIGTVGGGGVTRIGDGNLLMVYSHIAHDCEIGNNCILANCATLAGHIRIEDEAIIGGLVGIHQFCSVGRLAIVGGCSKVVKDIPPFMMADGHPARVRGANLEGLRRRKIPPSGVREIKEAYRTIFQKKGKLEAALESLKEKYPRSEYINAIAGFIAASQRGIAR